jgi:hypothetical protein
MNASRSLGRTCGVEDCGRDWFSAGLCPDALHKEATHPVPPTFARPRLVATMLIGSYRRFRSPGRMNVGCGPGQWFHITASSTFNPGRCLRIDLPTNSGSGSSRRAMR